MKTIVTKKSTSTNAAAQTTKEVLLEKFKVIIKKSKISKLVILRVFLN